VTLRFNETNPAVLLKTLTFVKELIDTAARREYEMSEYEATSFVPHLLLKVGQFYQGRERSVCCCCWGGGVAGGRLW
jgi:cytoskeleton-associated protein 5